MGTYVSLSVLPYQISQQDWTSVYKETVKLLQAYDFADLGEKKLFDTQIPVYVKSQEREEPSGYWKTCGDLGSKKFGETFKLYSDIKMYREAAPSSTNNETDILRDGESSVVVFDAKTQGYPYHLYILAIAMLIESRFPKFASVSGDIDHLQCVRAKQWADTRLSVPIKLPIRVDSQQLLNRFFPKSQHEKIELIERWTIADQEKILEIVYKYSDKETFHKWIKEKLVKYSSPTQIGAVKLLVYYLNLVKDLNSLFFMACKEEGGPKYKPEEMLGAITLTWVSIPPQKYDFLEAFRKIEGHPAIVERTFGMMVMDIKFPGREIRTYIPLTDVVEKFTSCFPDWDKKASLLLQQGNSRIEEELQEFYKSIAPMLVLNNKKESKSYYLDNEDAFLYFNNYSVLLSEKQDFYLKTVAYSIEKFLRKNPEIKEQLYSYEIESMKLILGKMLTEKFQTYLTKDAWLRLEGIQEKEFIITLLAKLILDDFYKLKVKADSIKLLRGMFENKLITEKITEYRNDPGVITYIQEMIDKKKNTN
ncbi:hypothetical protein KZX50_09975 [Bacillus infantis]|uniref:hypothetical protein n=1 Tax=Bacillus infantis TaxID=324767 RepID=UPI002005A19E|nr:hypothetical protein [Bacillus infantis]MCK6205763.1 hypothetical protein [Bacillus infantis]